MNDVSNDTSDANKQKVTFNQSVNVKYASNPTASLNSLPTSSFNKSIENKSAKSSLTNSSSVFNNPSRSSKLSINKLSTNQTTNQSKPSLKSSSLINQLKLFKLNTNQPKTTELNIISNHNQFQAQKMRTISTASEKNEQFKSKYGLNKTSNFTNNLLNKPAKTKSGIVVDEKTTISHKNTFDTGPVLASTTVSKNIDHYKLPYGKGENIETDEFGEKVLKHRNVRAYEERTKRKIRQEFDVPASAVVKKLNESTKLDKNNNEKTKSSSSSAQKKYIYGMNLSGGGLDTEEGGNSAISKSTQAAVLHSSNYSSNNSPFKEQTRISSSGKFMVDKAIQCELKKSKLKNEQQKFSETGWKHYIEEPEEPKLREFTSDKWYYDKHEFETGELVPQSSRQISNIGENHQEHKWTKKINPSSIEQKVETEKKVNTEYKHNLTGSFKVIKPDRDGTVTTYSNVKPLEKRSLGLNSAGQKVVSCNKTGEVIYSQVDKSKKRTLRDQIQTPLPSYADDSYSDEDEIELKKQNLVEIERPRSALKSSNSAARLFSRTPSPVSRSRMICLNIPSEKQKAKLHRERSMSPQIITDHLLTHAQTPRSSSTGPRVVRNRTYQLGYGVQPTSADAIEPPPQFATLQHKLPPKAPSSKLHRSSSHSNQTQVRRIPIEADSKWYYQTEQSNLSDQSSVFGLKKNRETLEETMSFVSSGSEFVDNKLDERIADSTIRELDKKKRHISYDNQKIRHSVNEAPIASSVWYKSIDEDYRKGMASNEICIPSLPNYSGESATMSRLEKKKSSSTSKAATDQAYTLDRVHLQESKKGAILSSKDKERLIKSSGLSRRPTQQASDLVDSSKISRNRQMFNSTRDLTTHLEKQQRQRSTSLTRYNQDQSESDASIVSGANLRTCGYRGLNYPLRPVTRSASMMHNPSSSLLRKNSSVIRSTESDHGYGPPNRPISRGSATSRISVIQNDPVVLYLPAINNSSKEINTLANLSKPATKTMGNKKLAASVNNLNTVSRSNSILSKLKTQSTSKKDLSKSQEKLNDLTVKLNSYQNSKTLANNKADITTKSKEIKRSHSIPKNVKLPLLQKLKNKLKSKDN